MNQGEDATDGSISLSFPNASGVRVLEASPTGGGGSHATVFGSGAMISHFNGSQIAARYPLAT